MSYISRQDYACEYAKTVIKDHQRDYYGHCYCGKYVLGSSYAAHLVNELLEAGIRLDIDDSSQELN